MSIKIRVRRWYVAMAIRLPFHQLPACVGFGLPRYESEARDVAMTLATELTPEDA